MRRKRIFNEEFYNNSPTKLERRQKMPDIDYDNLMKLRDLQDIDSEIRRIKAEVEKLSTEKVAIEEQLELCQSQCTQQTDAMGALKKEYKLFTDEVKEKERLIRKSNEKLMSVKNNREYQALLKEVDELKTSVSQIEDQMLECLEKTESAQNEMTLKEKALENAQQRVESERAQIEVEQAQKEERISELNANRCVLSEKVDNRLMEMFKKIQRLQADGRPVARAMNSTCTGCHMNIPAQMYNELHRPGEMRFCPFCQRMLYYEEDMEV
jgi:uncharacterized protein